MLDILYLDKTCKRGAICNLVIAVIYNGINAVDCFAVSINIIYGELVFLKLISAVVSSICADCYSSAEVCLGSILIIGIPYEIIVLNVSNCGNGICCGGNLSAGSECISISAQIYGVVVKIYRIPGNCYVLGGNGKDKSDEVKGKAVNAVIDSGAVIRIGERLHYGDGGICHAAGIDKG